MKAPSSEVGIDSKTLNVAEKLPKNIQHTSEVNKTAIINS